MEVGRRGVGQGVHGPSLKRKILCAATYLQGHPRGCPRLFYFVVHIFYFLHLLCYSRRNGDIGLRGCSREKRLGNVATTFLQNWFLRKFLRRRGFRIGICSWLLMRSRLCLSVSSARFCSSVVWQFLPKSLKCFLPFELWCLFRLCSVVFFSVFILFPFCYLLRLLSFCCFLPVFRI